MPLFTGVPRMHVLGNPPYLEVPVELALQETNPARTPQRL
jgi:hypothetical protein